MNLYVDHHFPEPRAALCAETAAEGYWLCWFAKEVSASGGDVRIDTKDGGCRVLLPLVKEPK